MVCRVSELITQVKSRQIGAAASSWNLVASSNKSAIPTHQEALAAAARAEVELGSPEEEWLAQPENVTCFALRSGSNAERQQSLCDTLRWRVKNRELLSSLTCSHCAADPRAHDCRIFGTDADGDAVIMNGMALPKELSPSGIAEHMTCVFELALRRFPGTAERPRMFTWVIDIHGFGYLSRHSDPRTSLRLLTLLRSGFRGRLKRILVVDAPTSFWALWAAVRQAIDEETAAMIEFVPWTEAPVRYPALFGDSLGARLLQEAMSNRDPACVATKTWTTFFAEGS